MSDQDKQCWPTAKVQRRLRADEALMEMVRAERVFLASRKQQEIPPPLSRVLHALRGPRLK
jgi:hypothetical protein